MPGCYVYFGLENYSSFARHFHLLVCCWRVVKHVAFVLRDIRVFRKDKTSIFLKISY